MSSSHLPACFRPSIDDHRSPPLPPSSPQRNPSVLESTSNSTDLTTCLYETTLGLISLTWSRSFLGHSLHLQLHPASEKLSPSNPSTNEVPASAFFHLHLKHFNFWKKTGSKKLPILLPGSDSLSPSPTHLRLYWDLSKANFNAADPAPVSEYYIAAVVDHELVLVVGDLIKQAILKTKPLSKPYQRDQLLVLRREHVFGNKLYKTRARINGKNREISIDCSLNSDAKLSIIVGKERVLVVKRLKWKFRGNEKVMVDGIPVNISWDVHNWLFQENVADGCGVFTFKFESLWVEEADAMVDENNEGNCSGNRFGSFRIRRRGKTTERSSSLSSVSVSSASSGCGSSVMEWSSVEENELLSPVGFTLLVYAWRR